MNTKDPQREIGAHHQGYFGPCDAGSIFIQKPSYTKMQRDVRFFAAQKSKEYRHV
jgi:hypothetical protein